jgi:hypothetical protein
MERKKQPFNLPDSARKALLRDAGHAPEDWHPDAHLRREMPLGQPVSPTREIRTTGSKLSR